MMVFTGLSCSIKKEFQTKEELIRTIIECINEGDKDSIYRSLLTREDYIKNIHDYTDAADPDSGLPAEDFWRIFIAVQRDGSVARKVNFYRGRIVKIKSIGKEEQLFDYKDFKMHRKTPVVLILRDGNGREYEVVDDEIFGSIIERDGRFILFNVFS